MLLHPALHICQIVPLSVDNMSVCYRIIDLVNLFIEVETWHPDWHTVILWGNLFIGQAKTGIDIVHLLVVAALSFNSRSILAFSTRILALFCSCTAICAARSSFLVDVASCCSRVWLFLIDISSVSTKPQAYSNRSPDLLPLSEIRFFHLPARKRLLQLLQRSVSIRFILIPVAWRYQEI